MKEMEVMTEIGEDKRHGDTGAVEWKMTDVC